MAWEALPGLPVADVDAGRVWAESGCQWLTAAGVDVPVRLVRTVAGLVDHLDEAGAGLAERFGANGLGVLSERAAALMLRPAGQVSCGGASRLLPSADGWVAITLARPDDRRLLPAWLGLDPAAPCVRTNADPWSEVARRVRDRSTADLVELATVLGLACAGVGETAPGPALFVERVGEAIPRPPAGLRVANLAPLWAGPLAAAVLVRLGADVVCVESTGRPDGARATPGWFDAIHAGQRSVALDFRTDDGVSRLTELLHAADLVIEGSRPRALEQLGVRAADVVRNGPRVWASITGHGREAHDGMRVGYGDDAAAAGGLVGDTDSGPVFLADAVADPITGLAVAAAVVDLIAAGGRWLVDAALARVASATASVASDPIVPSVHPSAEPRAAGGRARPFALGADTAAVLDEWVG